MSLGYAQKLSFREDVGAVGMSEVFEPADVLQQKIEELASIIQKSKHLVAFTGAGISTSCGIPDFRGPKGVWTLQREGKGVPDASLPFHCAVPSLTHMALVELERMGVLKFVISQNVDSLHLRSGIPREKLAELHGNSFREVCPSCGAEYIRDFEIETIGMKVTSRRCSDVDCGAKLKDTVLDWEDALPSKEMNAAEKHCKAADTILCLGTSLQITPACNLPLKCLRGGGKIVIVNLQQTPKDKKASLVIHGLVDKVIAGVMHLLNVWIPPYVRTNLVKIYFSHSQRKKTYVKWNLRIASVHGPRAPLPFLKSVEVSFLDRPDLKATILNKQPFFIKRQTARARPFKMTLKLNLIEGCGCSFTLIEWPVNFQVKEVSFKHETDMIIGKLKDTTVESSSCGHHAMIERKVNTRDETSLYAIVTNICKYSTSFTPKACITTIIDNVNIKESCGLAVSSEVKPIKEDHADAAADNSKNITLSPKSCEAIPDDKPDVMESCDVDVNGEVKTMNKDHADAVSNIAKNLTSPIFCEAIPDDKAGIMESCDGAVNGDCKPIKEAHADAVNIAKSNTLSPKAWKTIQDDNADVMERCDQDVDSALKSSEYELSDIVGSSMKNCAEGKVDDETLTNWAMHNTNGNIMKRCRTVMNGEERSPKRSKEV